MVTRGGRGRETQTDEPVEMASTEQLKVTKRFSFAGLTNWSDSSPKVESLNLDKVCSRVSCGQQVNRVLRNVRYLSNCLELLNGL